MTGWKPSNIGKPVFIKRGVKMRVKTIKRLDVITISHAGKNPPLYLVQQIYVEPYGVLIDARKLPKSCGKKKNTAKKTKKTGGKHGKV